MDSNTKFKPRDVSKKTTERGYHYVDIYAINGDIGMDLYNVCDLIRKIGQKNRCKENEQELLAKYSGNLTHEAAIERSVTIGAYTKDLPLKIEAEYRSNLESLWKKDCTRNSACSRRTETPRVDDRGCPCRN